MRRTVALFWQQIDLGADGIITEVYDNGVFAHMWFALFNPSIYGPCVPKPQPQWLDRWGHSFTFRPTFMAIRQTGNETEVL